MSLLAKCVIPNGAGRFFLLGSLLRTGRPADVRNLSSVLAFFQFFSALSVSSAPSVLNLFLTKVDRNLV
jgi:hypothetical protein